MVQIFMSAIPAHCAVYTEPNRHITGSGFILIQMYNVNTLHFENATYEIF